jgi:hypothetical protein
LQWHCIEWREASTYGQWFDSNKVTVTLSIQTAGVIAAAAAAVVVLVVLDDGHVVVRVEVDGVIMGARNCSRVGSAIGNATMFALLRRGNDANTN